MDGGLFLFPRMQETSLSVNGTCLFMIMTKLALGCQYCPHEDNKHPRAYKHSLHKQLLPAWAKSRVCVCEPAQSDMHRQSICISVLARCRS